LRLGHLSLADMHKRPELSQEILLKF
jgi:hypothetical protein